MSGSNIKLGFLLLCHEKPQEIYNKLSLIFFKNKNVKIYLHYDKRQTKQNKTELRNLLKNNKNVVFCEKTVLSKWGEFSLVEATLNMMEVAIKDKDFTPDYLYLISASCLPIKPLNQLQEFLSINNGKEFIEAVDVENETWIKGGIDTERYKYYYPFNFRTQNWLFENYKSFQNKIGIDRKVPNGVKIHFGSQWFCLTLKTIKKVYEKFQENEIFNFFKKCWIPDEFAIQSLVASNVQYNNISNFSLTYSQFNSEGKPITFYNDHIEELKNYNFFFARKVSKIAAKLNQLCETNNEFNYKAAGVKSASYDIFVSNNLNKNKGSKIARINDTWKSGIEKNEKEFIIITGPSRDYIRYINNIVRQQTDDYAILDYIFKNNAPEIVADKKDAYGFSILDKKIRDYNRSAYLYQIINSIDKKVIISLDLEDNHDIREIVRWTDEATIIIVDPFNGKKMESLISRLHSTLASEFCNVNESELTKAIEDYFSKFDLYYWQRIIDECEAHINFIEHFHSDIGKKYQNAINSTNINDILSNENVALLNHYNNINERFKFKNE